LSIEPELSKELDLNSALNQAENSLSAQANTFPDLQKLHSMIDLYKDSLKAEGKSIEELKMEIGQLTSIDTISNFNPVKFHLGNPTSVSIWLTILTWLAALVVFYIILPIIHCLFPEFFGNLKKKLSTSMQSLFQTICSYSSNIPLRTASFRASYRTNSNPDQVPQSEEGQVFLNLEQNRNISRPSNRISNVYPTFSLLRRKKQVKVISEISIYQLMLRLLKERPGLSIMTP